jgi:hypothetical protein
VIKEERIVWSGFASELFPEQLFLFCNRFSNCVINGNGLLGGCFGCALVTGLSIVAVFSA